LGGKTLNKTIKKIMIGLLSITFAFGIMTMNSTKEVKATMYGFYSISNYNFSSGTDVNLGYRTKAIDGNWTGYYSPKVAGNQNYTWRFYLTDKTTQAMNYVNGCGEVGTSGTLYTAYRAAGKAFRYKAANSHTGYKLTLEGNFKTSA